MIRVLIAEPLDFSSAARAVLEEVSEVELRALSEGALAGAFADYDVVWLRLGHRVEAGDLGEAPRCRILAVPATGTDHVDLAACERAGIEVLSLKGEVDFLRGVRATAEMTIALTLALLRKLPEAAEHVRAGGWDRDRFRGRELAGKTAGVVGVGRLGEMVARLLAAFEMRVLGFDPHREFSAGVAERRDRLEDLLAESDLVSLHVPFSPATRHLMNQEAFAAMKPGAVLVNTSRGGVIDESALLEALESGRLAGAALDVLEGEPGISRAHPLVAAAQSDRRLLVVPHLGGNTWESLEKAELFLARKVASALRSRS